MRLYLTRVLAAAVVTIVVLYFTFSGNGENLNDISVPTKPEKYRTLDADHLYSSKSTESMFSFDFYPVESNIWIGDSFLDIRNSSKRQMLTTVLMESELKHSEVHCIFDTTMNKGEIYEFCENHNKPFGGFMVICPIPEAAEDISEFQIRVGKSRVYSAAPIRTILNETAYRTYAHNFTICVPPLFGDEYVFENIVEFMEISYALGADHVILYTDQSLKDRFDVIIEYYVSIGFVSIVHWNIPDLASDSIHYHGQIIAVQDCLYRTAGNSKYVIFQDIDEIFVPHRGKSWFSAVDSIFNRIPKLAGLGVPTYYLPVKDRTFPVTANNIQISFSPDYRFTKCIVRPELIFEMGIHHISKPVREDLVVRKMDFREGQLFHFKNCRNRQNEPICRSELFHPNDRLRAFKNMLLLRHEQISAVLETQTLS